MKSQLKSHWCGALGEPQRLPVNEPIGHFTIRPSRVFETLSLSVNILTNAASATLLLCGK